MLNKRTESFPIKDLPAGADNKAVPLRHRHAHLQSALASVFGCLALETPLCPAAPVPETQAQKPARTGIGRFEREREKYRLPALTTMLACA